MSNDDESDHVPTDDEYAQLMQRAIASTRDADFEHLWNAFHEWLDEQVKTGPWNQYEVRAGVFHLVGGDVSWWRRKLKPKVRTQVEEAFFGEYLPKQPRDVQAHVVAEMWRCAEQHDTRSQQLVGAISAMSKTMPREEIWRMLQATADAYRAGEPLNMKDRVTLLARKFLPEKTWNRTMADALKENGSTAKNHQHAASQLVSKAEEHRAEPLPDDGPDLDGTTVRLHETYPLVGDMVRHLFKRGILRRKTLKECVRDPESEWYLANDPEAEANLFRTYDAEDFVTEVDKQEYPGLASIDAHVDIDDILKVADPEQQNPQVADPQQR